MAAKKESKKKVGIIATAGAVILIVLIVALISGFTEKEEVFPTFQDVGGTIETQVGDYKLDKQAYLGDPNAPVKVVEFVDYKCPYCAAWTNNNLPKFKKDYIDTGKVQLFVVNFPFLGPDSIKAAMVGEILWKQNHEAFWEYTDALYAHQGEEKTIWANEKYLLSIIKKYVPHGDADAVKKSLKNLEGLFEVKEDFKITSTNGVSSVPTFIVDGKKYVNPDLTQFSDVIDSSLADAQK
ncbi:DsbA family protein [Paenibacillus illinoisensis]|uniref:DsbA family protein n=1 Tax=Paenibacillus illinoisensis TaxID=59845 RepID=UPI00301BB1D7